MAILHSEIRRSCTLGVFTDLVTAYDWIDGEGTRQYPEVRLEVRTGSTRFTFVVVDADKEDRLRAEKLIHGASPIAESISKYSITRDEAPKRGWETTPWRGLIGTWKDGGA